MSPKSFEYSRYDDHEIQAILRDTEHRPNRLIVFLSWELNNAKRHKTALRVDDEMYYFADSVSAPEIDPGLVYHLPRKWDAPNLDWVAGETHQPHPQPAVLLGHRAGRGQDNQPVGWTLEYLPPDRHTD